jgi:hypothetical protein
MSGHDKRRKTSEQLVNENLRISAWGHDTSAPDPLAWLRAELCANEDVPELPPERLAELDKLATWLNKSPQRRVGALSSPALEAFLALCPSESLSPSLVERVEARRKAALDAKRVSENASEAARKAGRYGSDAAPGLVFAVLRTSTHTSLEAAAAALGIAPAELDEVERGTPPWDRIEPKRLPDFAALVQQSCDHVVVMLRVVFRAHFLSQVERRLGVGFARADTLQTKARAKRAQLDAALAVLRHENQGAQRFFTHAAEVANAARAAPIRHNPDRSS